MPKKEGYYNLANNGRARNPLSRSPRRAIPASSVQGRAIEQLRSGVARSSSYAAATSAPFFRGKGITTLSNLEPVINRVSLSIGMPLGNGGIAGALKKTQNALPKVEIGEAKSASYFPAVDGSSKVDSTARTAAKRTSSYAVDNRDMVSKLYGDRLKPPALGVAVKKPAVDVGFIAVVLATIAGVLLLGRSA